MDATKRPLSIACGSSCNAKRWTNKQMTWDEYCEKMKAPTRTPETAEEYRAMSKSDRDKAKDCGGYVFGYLKDNRRLDANVTVRSAVVLDGDNVGKGFPEQYRSEHKYASLMSSTHSHTTDRPRVRLVFPMTRDISPDENTAISRIIAADMGIEKFDACSFKANQLMYWPSAPRDGEYLCDVFDGEWLDPDKFLSEYPNWTDFSTLPMTSEETQIKDTAKKHQQDPLTKDGIIGAFCRTYTIAAVIEEYLSDVYEPTVSEDRFTYIKGESAAGLVVYDGKFAYSHHATDPANGKLLNAFDLVRIHKFGNENTKKSNSEMCTLASQDENVSALLLAEKREQALADFAAPCWEKQLEREKDGSISDSLHNASLIMENDSAIKGIVFNQLADGLEIKGKVPWKHPSRFWRDADDAQLVCYIDRNYGMFSARNYEIAMTKAADDRSYHPIKEYFASLPKWDGIPRVDTVFIDYLGADDTPYVRSVTRKALCAAHRRIFEPGIKFDSMPVLNGPQGIGKSTIIAKLGMDWFSDSLSLSDMNDKTAAEKLQGYWLLEIGELAGMKKADIDKVKAFISRTDDKYRASFGRRVTPHPRQCIFIGTTNAENGYLRDTTGNRRYWNIRVNGNGKYKPWEMSRETVDQIWAEVAVLSEKGETLYLPSELEQYAEKEQKKAMEQDEREGLVQEYLDMLLPDDWDSMDSFARRNYINDRNDPTRPVGTRRRNEVSNIEIWCECFGKPKEDMKPSDSYTITAMMVRFPDWERSGERKRIPLYGQQRTYIRKQM